MFVENKIRILQFGVFASSFVFKARDARYLSAACIHIKCEMMSVYIYIYIIMIL